MAETPAGQVATVFDNIEAVLTACGGSLDDVVRLTIYVTTDAVRDALADERRKRFHDGQRQASTYLMVASLPLPELLVEIEAVAIIDDAVR